jgi:hypothetical protein
MSGNGEDLGRASCDLDQLIRTECRFEKFDEDTILYVNFTEVSLIWKCQQNHLIMSDHFLTVRDKLLQEHDED